jgi:beta-lactamase class A
MILRCVAVLALLAGTALAEESPLQQRAAELCAEISLTPKDPARQFVPAFLAQVPPARLEALLKGLAEKYGRCTSARPVRASGPMAGEIVVVFEKRFEAKAQLVVEPALPYLISTFLIKPPAPQLQSLDEVLAKLKPLAGTTSLLVTPLDGGKPLVAWNDEQPLAVGSAFKLYVVAELARSGRKPDEVVTLRAEQRSLPSGIAHQWPPGAPVTLHTLATLMISLSDNTATDMLIETLGRETIEKHLAASGHKHPAGMRPLLLTREMFRLKIASSPQLRTRYAKAKETERRKILAELATDKRTLREAVNDAFSRPIEIESIEWFASAGDLCRVMATLRPLKPLRDVLAVDNPLGLDAVRWPFVGFKGGSEPGVMNLTFLLERDDGKAFCVSGTWNDPKTGISEETLLGLVGSAISLIP